MIEQINFRLRSRSRGFHIVTEEIVSALPDLTNVRAGMCNLFLQHTSASLAINENADPTVRVDLESFVNRLIPDGSSWLKHITEGDDDMPAHIKAVVIGPSLVIPISNGRLALGTWQGIYLCEHRDRGGARSIVATIFS
ncbi:MAG: YjbQ family protein [Leptospirales bacterium]|nr:YjbQ family protein [Leptospirales bacterium]